MQKKYLISLVSVVAVCTVFSGSLFAGGRSKPAKPKLTPIQKYQQGWVHKAIKSQREMQRAIPLSLNNMIQTHNSYNSSKYRTAVSYYDPNHVLTMYDQLQMDARILELDLHWYFSMEGWPWNWKKKILLCHGQSSHMGCSSHDRTLEKGLEEINRFIRESKNRKEVLIIYLEDHVDGQYYELSRILTAYFGDLIYRPNNKCDTISQTVSPQDVINAGKNILLITDGCRDSNNLGAIAFAGTAGRNGFLQSNIQDFTFSPCKWSMASAQKYISRIYEDRTRISKYFGGITKHIWGYEIQEMFRCGVGIPGLDKLEVNDQRLTDFVWSWAANEPNNYGGNEDCAVMHFGLWNDDNCNSRHRFSCKNSAGEWKVTQGSGPWTSGKSTCTKEFGSQFQFASPTTATEKQKLFDTKMQSNKNVRTWIAANDRASEGAWTFQP